MQTFGIEIECFLPAGVSRAAVARAISEAGAPCFDAGYSHTTTPQWKIVTDGSLSGGANGMEIVSPPLSGPEGFRAVDIVSATLVRLGATVNQSCGLHVHVGARQMPAAALRKLAALYIEHEPLLDSLMPPSRRGSRNTYCGTLRSTDMQRLAQASDAAGIASAIAGGNRYVKLNFTSYWRHGTVEFRHHSGTVDGAKIKAWISVCLRLVACAQAEASQPITVTTQARPRNARAAVIYDLISRPEGASREEVAARLGRRTMPPLNRILAEHGIAYREETRGRRARYYARQTTAPNAQPATWENFVTRIGLTAAERSYLEARRAALANIPAALRSAA